ncbi:hypothetical protein D3C85_1254990 [compost metagenome]
MLYRGFRLTRPELLLALMNNAIHRIEQDQHDDLHDVREEHGRIRLVYRSDHLSGHAVFHCNGIRCLIVIHPGQKKAYSDDNKMDKKPCARVDESLLTKACIDDQSFLGMRYRWLSGFIAFHSRIEEPLD